MEYDYLPDRWVVVKIEPNDNLSNMHYRVFASWKGGYLDGDSWKLNSGITEVVDGGKYYDFKGSSGSVYRCRKNSYGTTGTGALALHDITYRASGHSKVTLVDEDTDWMKLQYK